MTNQGKLMRGKRKIKEKERRQGREKNTIIKPSFAEVQCASAQIQPKRNAQIVILS